MQPSPKTAPKTASKTTLTHRLHAASAELLLRRAQLATLRAKMAASELQLATLRAQLHSFEARYIRQVGVLYVQLDQWEARIAELEVASESIEDTERLLRAAQQREQQHTLAPEPEPAPAARPAPSLRSLFRELARRIHPDFAINPLDALHRTHLMAQANDAYLRADATQLLRMLHHHELPFTPQTAAESLAETLTLLAQTQSDLAALDTELSTLAASEMAALHDRTRAAAITGRDLLAEMAAQVKGRIGIAMRRYELDLGRARRKQPRLDPTPLLSAERFNP
jgi:hypothetical protein